MPFHFEDRTLAQITSIAITEVKGALGHYLVVFDATCQIVAGIIMGSAPSVEITGGHVEVVPTSGARIALGYLQPKWVKMESQSSAPRIATWSLTLELPSERLAALERVRNGGDLKFQVRLHARCRHNAREEGGFDDGSVAVPQSEWVRLLAKMGYTNLLLLEVPLLSADASPELADAASRLASASDLFRDGRYAKVVQECRHVLEAVGHSLGDSTGAPALLKEAMDRGQQDKLTKEQRLLVIRRALFVMSCIPSHSKDPVSITTTWDRHEAAAMLTMAASVVQWVAGDLDR